MLAEGEALLARAAALPGAAGPYQLLAAVHSAHASRRRTGVTPWPAVLGLYEALARVRPGPVVMINRAVALAQVAGPEAGLAALDAADAKGVADWLPFHAARADLLARAGRPLEARAAYVRALALAPAPAERAFLEKQLAGLPRN
jgi:RNA polymerase sigma-70 factor (ECF subfamily)